jgi:large subunit ribosomal protein L21
MFAIVRTGGKQYKVAPGDIFEVELLKAETASKIVLDEVLLVGDENEWTVGTPTVEGAGVECTVVNAIRGPKIKVFKYKAKKRYRRLQGHRQELTVLRVDDVRIGGSTAAAPKKAKATAASKTKASGKTAATASARASTKSATKAVAKAKSKAAAKPKQASRSKPASKSTARAKPASRRKPK